MVLVKFTSPDGYEICALLGYYAARGGNSSQTFRDNLSFPSSRVKMNMSYVTSELTGSHKTKASQCPFGHDTKQRNFIALKNLAATKRGITHTY